MSNTHKMKTNAELSPYQKRIENIDSPILCVSEVEKMINEIGCDLASEIQVTHRPKSILFKSRTVLLCFRMKRI